MRTLPFALLLSCLLLGSPTSSAQETRRIWTAEQQEVLDAISAGPVGIENPGTFESWASGYHAAWTYWRLGAAAVRPRNEHMELVRAYVQAGNHVVDFELEPIGILVRGDTAIVRLNAAETIAEADGATRIARYSSVAVLVREQGRWLLLASNLLHLPDGE